MIATRTRLPGVLGVVASLLGIFFSAFSTHDYALHLDRQLHDTHCSFIPGLTEATTGANACTAAMYSPYSALLRDHYWGGVPISLFALGAYAFFLPISVHLLTAGNAASKRAWQGFGFAALTPLIPSVVMFFLSLTRLGAFCKLCVGLYLASIILFVAGVIALRKAGGAQLSADNTIPDPNPFGAALQATTPPGYPEPAYLVPPSPTPLTLSSIPQGHPLVIPGLLVSLGAFALAPAGIYVTALPDYQPLLTSCGKLTDPSDKHNALVKMPGTRPREKALLLVDPLCPTCKNVHERLAAEGILEQLDARVAIFPLDNECNWMLDRPLHPGACILARAFLCSEPLSKARWMLDWSFAYQE
ncbi:MAG: vitamin K epoxide reductase family protein, partial [Myxococcales bacterium]|nr:hypothetical protein [Polyangiaceae bacterium]MDW8250907.1 vitamin K epoxide reductase family protein [Myxococcales bacterium]